MSDKSLQIALPSHWDGQPFKLPPLPFRARVRRTLTDLFCFIGMTLAKAARTLRRNGNAIAPRKILVVRRGGLGDVLMATPLLRQIREHFPSASVFVLTSRQGFAALDGSPWVDGILEVPTSIRGWPPLLRKLRKERIDTAFILHRFFAASLVAVCAGIPRRLGFSWKNHGFALTGAISFTPAYSQTLQIGQLLTLLDKPAAEPDLEFAVDEDAIRCAREILKAWGFNPDRVLVGIHAGGGETVGSSEPPKRWLPERFGQLADRLMRSGVQVVMLQGPGDQPFVDQAIRHMSAQPLGIASGLRLGVFAALMRECALVVVNDSGPMHIAATQKIPVVAIIGPTHPAYTPPRGEMDRVIWAGAVCSPCYNPEEYIFGTHWRGQKVFKCWRSTHECMAAVTVDHVYYAVMRHIQAVENKALDARQKERYRSAHSAMF